jgi:hypothetical protein
VDYRRFIDSRELVAPVVEHGLWLADRRLRLDVDAGWYRANVRGREVEVLAPATAEEVAPVLASLPPLGGPLVRLGRDWLVATGGNSAFPVELGPRDVDPPLFAPLRARRWPIGGLVLWDELLWEDDTEEAARRALEEGRGLQDVKGASAALRAAFAFAAAQKASRTLHIPAMPVELARWVGRIADQGVEAAQTALLELDAQRVVTETVADVRARSPQAPNHDVEARMERSLRGSGAQLLSARRVGEGQVEVRWQFLASRFISVVDEACLQVIDAGVCLDGCDNLVTLDSLPGVIREAMNESELVVTRHEEEV